MFTPKHHELTARLRVAIVSKKYGIRLPAIRVLCSEYSVSMQTMHKSIRPLVEEGLVVPGPRGSVICNPEKREHYNAVGVVAGHPLPFGDFAHMYEATVKLARDAGLRTVFITFQGDELLQDPDYLTHFPVDGVLFCYSTLCQAQLRALEYARIPLVAGAFWWGEEAGQIVQSNGDLSKGIAVATEKIRAFGHRRVVWFEGSRRPDYQPYLEYMRKLWSQTGLEVDDWIVSMQSSSLSAEAFYTGFTDVLISRYLALPPAHRPTVLVGGSDYLLKFRQGVTARGIRIPEDLSLVFFDSGSYESNPLTGISFDPRARACWGMRQLLAIMRGEEPEAYRMNQRPAWKKGTSLAPVP